MTQVTWEKNADTAAAVGQRLTWNRRYAYLIVGLALVGAVAYLVVTGLVTGGQYYITVDELLADSDKVGKSVRVAGAVDGNTIGYDPVTHELSFTVAHIPNDGDAIQEAGGLAEVLYVALQDDSATRMQVVWENGEVPDLLQHEAQAIMTGTLGEDGIFYANQVFLKCPTRYSDEVPQQAASTE